MGAFPDVIEENIAFGQSFWTVSRFVDLRLEITALKESWPKVLMVLR
jgi:hypothetical protein